MAGKDGKFVQMRRGEPVLASKDPMYRRFFEKISNDDLVDALARSDNKKHQELLRQICLPKRRGSVASAAKACNLTLGELNTFWRDANMEKARDIAFKGIPKAMTDVVTDACNTQVVCPRCDGLGTLDPGPDYDDMPKRKKSIVRECPECDGTGKVRKSGDIESRKLLFETTGLTGKRGPLVAIQNNHYAPSSLETFVDTFDKMDALPMIEGETEND